MKKIALILLLAATCAPAASVKISDLTRTNGTLDASSLFEVSAANGAGGYATRAVSLADAVSGSGAARAHILDFNILTNDAIAKTTYLAPDGQLWFQLYSGPTVSNYSTVSNGVWRTDFDFTTNSSTWFTKTNDIDPEAIVVNYRFKQSRLTGSDEAGFAILVGSNGFGSPGGGPFLSSGLHITFGSGGVVVGEVSGGSVGGALGTIDWEGGVFPGSPPDSLWRTVMIRIDRTNNVVAISGDNLLGRVTNELIGVRIGTNRAAVAFEQYALGSLDQSLVEFSQIGVGNTAWADTYSIRQQRGVAAQLNADNFFRGNNYGKGLLYNTNIVGIFGSGSSLIQADRDATPGDNNRLWNMYPNNYEYHWAHNAASAQTLMRMGYNGFQPYFAPGIGLNGLAMIGVPTNRFQGFFGASNNFVGLSVKNSVGNTSSLLELLGTNNVPLVVVDKNGNVDMGQSGQPFGSSTGSKLTLNGWSPFFIDLDSAAQGNVRFGMGSQSMFYTGLNGSAASGGLVIPSGGLLGWSANASGNNGADTALHRGASGVLAQRNGVLAQTNMVQGRYHSASIGQWIETGYDNTDSNMFVRANSLGTNTPSLKLGVSNTVAMTITPAGNVGIGTTTPDDALDVVGNAQLTGGLTVGTGLQVSGGNGLVLGVGGAVMTNIVVASATLDFAAQTVGAVEDLPITVTAAAIGDYVTVSPPPGSITGIVGSYSGFASNGAVYVRFVSTGTAQNPPSGTFKVKVEKFQ